MEMNKRREKPVWVESGNGIRHIDRVPVPRGKDRAGSGVETEVGLAALKVETSSK
jgi:hypothetical protein